MLIYIKNQGGSPKIAQWKKGNRRWSRVLSMNAINHCDKDDPSYLYCWLLSAVLSSGSQLMQRLAAGSGTPRGASEQAAC